ncbi:glycoside hydrolase family 20 zincin-like fold domain-containing protein [Aureibaculum sp. 2210JD6-5]|uniref:glycoside hydrolase family 20 zincin-like fold domain-containing protein n=1 Tax=Aureibaculum sp. 2210JD6-5 TaxID=3103957 RepID=UPI002AAE5FE3|nr:glycoside hydrolase family 20 zincin-like fold domain-containing protein [Aureibaculum sp. 2210JD6-5]MDY7394236.1 glycoside hydrolase family 20 zincin-like fold domain-containing protein [Aureibaculum sp. 2210JD6-5]
MTKLKAVFCCFILLATCSCQSPQKKSGDFKLLPLPQKFEINGNSLLKYNNIKSYFSLDTELPVLGNLLTTITDNKKPEGADIIYNIDTTLAIGNQGYKLTISKNQIQITGKDKAGLFYGFKTLEQLLQDAKEQDVYLPECSITDFPLLSYRSVHLDIKHHLEKTDYYYQLIDKLASYKVNGIIVEMEDKLKYERQPEIASADALSIGEWKKLSDYAKERHIEISPLIQGLGHASFILKHEKYKHLRDDPKSDWAFNPLDPETYEVQFDFYLDAIAATPHGKYLHIGGDEVHTTGRNSGKSSLELQLMWLNKVCKFAEEHNRIPIFWDDMPLKLADVYKPMFDVNLNQQEVDSIWAKNEHKLSQFLPLFPKNCIYMRWNYNNSEALGNAKAMEWFRNHGMEVMGATSGQTRWVLMPQEESNMDNIKSFALSSINNDLNGLLLTLWDDDSPHFELYNRGIIAFSEYTWTGEKRTKENLKSAYRQREFSHEVAGAEFAFIDSLEKPVAFWKNALLNGNRRNYLKSNKSAISEDVIDLPDPTKKGAWSDTHKVRLDKVQKMLTINDSVSSKITALKSKANRNTYTLEVYEQVNKLTTYTSKALLALKAYDNSQNKDQELEAVQNLKQLKEEFTNLRSEFERVYGKTRILKKPDNYILDQDHHVHLANQSISFDWQFYAELLFLQKLDKELLKNVEKIVD